MVNKMKVKCYAILDAKVKEFHLAVFDLQHEGAIRQFSDVVQDSQTKWNKHPEDYSLWYVGDFDTEKGKMDGVIPENLVNAVAVMSITKPIGQMELFGKNGEKEKQPVN